MNHLKFENTRVYNFAGAFYGMRNPKNSWHLGDSVFGLRNFREMGFDETNEVAKSWTIQDGYNPDDESFEEHFLERENWIEENGILNLNPIQQIAEVAYIGPKDMKLAQTLIRGGSEHRKFLRQIFVSVDITAPLFWYKEFDTYKVGTVANSTSTMHKIASAPITLNNFKFDSDLFDLPLNPKDANEGNFVDAVSDIINTCEKLRQLYLSTNDSRYWKALIEILPESWVQKRTITMNYENLISMYHQRKSHKLPEWREDFVEWVKTLPYANELILYNDTCADS